MWRLRESACAAEAAVVRGRTVETHRGLSKFLMPLCSRGLAKRRGLPAVVPRAVQIHQDATSEITAEMEVST